MLAVARLQAWQLTWDAEAEAVRLKAAAEVEAMKHRLEMALEKEQSAREQQEAAASSPELRSVPWATDEARLRPAARSVARGSGRLPQYTYRGERRAHHGAPKRHPKHPKGPQKASKRPPRAPQGTPKVTKKGQKRLPGTPLDRRSLYLGRPLESTAPAEQNSL